MSRWLIMIGLCAAIGCGDAPAAKVVAPNVTENANAVAPASFESAADKADPSGITLTPRAAAQVRELIVADPERNKLRVSIVDAFQGEMQWRVAMIRVADPFDDETFESAGITMVVDRATRPFIDGTKIDYVDKNGKAKFVFENVRVKPANR